jgi:nitrogen PTS system EIIA component
MHGTDAARTSIGLAEVFRPEAIVLGLKNRSKTGAIAELIQHMTQRGYIREDQEGPILEGILSREKLGSTALWGGVAFPHCRSSCTDRFVGILGIEPAGIPFEDTNGGPVHSIFLFLAPLEQREELYEVLGRITAIGRDKSRLAQLRGCLSAGAAHRLLQEFDR